MGADFEDAIVAYVDLIGTIKNVEDSAATLLMRGMHRDVQGALSDNDALQAIAHAYAWNDSLLLVLQTPEPATYRKALQDVAALRSRLSVPSYAIVVKGQIFPPLPPAPATADRLTVLRSSSFAMANCLHIEPLAKVKAKELRRLNQPTPCWYIDERIVDHVGELRTLAIDHFVAPMLPTGGLRTVWCFEATALRPNGDESSAPFDV
jgi:hypothetical protein